MANYVCNKVVCSKKILDRYFIDPEPLGKEYPVSEP